MRKLRSLIIRFGGLFNKGRKDRELQEEIESHVQMHIEDNLQSGMTPLEARRQAMIQLGGIEATKQAYREQRGLPRLETLWQDLRYGVRTLCKNPGFTTVAVLTLALGIGLNTAMFSLLNVLVLRPLPFEHSRSLVSLSRTTQQNESTGFSPADYLDLKRGESTFGQFAGYVSVSVTSSEPGRPAELHDAFRVSADFFNVLNVQPEVGRTFRSEEETFGNHRVAVLSHAAWQNRFGGTSNIVGRIIRVEGEAYTIIGVLPAWANDDHVIRQAGFFLPLVFNDRERFSRDSQWINILGRRANSISVAQGNAFVSSFGARLAADFPKENGGSRWRSRDLLGSTGHSSGRVIIVMLLCLSGFVLLIACSNLANFLLARNISRSRELAVRTALGASRFRLIRLLAFEPLVLASVGGVGALFVSVWASAWLSAQAVATGGAPMEFPLDWRVLCFAIAASLFTASIFGIAPGLLATRITLTDALKSGARGATDGRGLQRLRNLLIIGQFAMAMTLLAGAGFFVRGADNLLRQHTEGDASHTVVAAFELPESKYRGNDDVVAFDRQAIERIEQLPGVKAVSISYAPPYFGMIGPRHYVAEGRERAASGLEPLASYNGVTSSYFDATGSRMLSGRMFNTTDSATSPKVVIINESMARALFPNESPIGRRISQADTDKRDWAEIVGVAADVGAIGLYQKPVSFQVYQPFVQDPWRYANLSVRTADLAPESLLASIRAAFTALDPDLPLRGLMRANTMIARSSSDVVMLEKMLGAFALLGLALAALGIYGVIARTVVQRTGEIGTRMALGAQVADVIRPILASGIRLALIGASIGVVGALGLARLIASIMPAMQTNGGLVLAATTVLLVLLALAACWLPARRAAKVDPMVALRHE